MTGVWIGAAILLLVVLPIVVVLLKGVLDAATSIVPAIDSIAATAEAGSKDLDAAAAAADHAGAGAGDDRRRRRVRRLARRDPRRRGAGMSAAAAAMILAVVLIVLALVYFLVATIFQLRKIVAGLDRVIVHVGGIVEKSAPVNEIVDDINANLDAGVAALEGLLVKKAGMRDAVGLVDGIYPGAAAAGLRDFPESKDVVPPRIGEVYTQGHAHAGAARARGADRRRQPARRRRSANIEGGSLAARMLYPDGRAGTGAAELPRSPGHRHRLARAVRAA